MAAIAKRNIGDKLDSPSMWRALLIFLAATFLRCCTSYHPYSGKGKGPMFGDYEAQRHWQEVTLNLEVRDWYLNTSNNDLNYWGLDYPPLTAYHSLVLGHVAQRLDPEYVALHASRGHESDGHKHFMRLSVLLADLLVFFPAVFHFVYKLLPNPRTAWVLGFGPREALAATILFYPGLVLIDHGHFQYNCVSLGLFVAAATFVFHDSFLPGSFFFVLALNYKQMELYHALPFFFYILGRSLFGGSSAFSRTRRLAAVAATVLASMAIVWAPFLHCQGSASVLLRLFPLARGIFEDKVANVWCALNVIFKFREVLTNAQLAQMCLAATAMAVLPHSLDLLFRPSRGKFLLALVNSSLAFFLLSFQVHEKSILLVAIPVLLHLHKDPLPCSWFLVISTFSMLPLLLKDGLELAYFAWRFFYGQLLGGCWISGDESKTWSRVAFRASVVGMDVLSVASVVLEPPTRYPDIFPLLISLYSCAHFVLFFLYFNYRQIFTGKLKVG